jgi:hypothetical protein
VRGVSLVVLVCLLGFANASRAQITGFPVPQRFKCADHLCVGDQIVSADRKQNICRVQTILTESRALFGGQDYIKAYAGCEDKTGLDAAIGNYALNFLANGCIPSLENGPSRKVCVGDVLLTEDSAVKVVGIDRALAKGAAMNRYDRELYMVEDSSGVRSRESYLDLARSSGCFRGICAGNSVVVSSVKSNGAQSAASGQAGKIIGSVEKIYLDGDFGVRVVDTQNRSAILRFSRSDLMVSK